MVVQPEKETQMVEDEESQMEEASAVACTSKLGSLKVGTCPRSFGSRVGFFAISVEPSILPRYPVQSQLRYRRCSHLRRLSQLPHPLQLHRYLQLLSQRQPRRWFLRHYRFQCQFHHLQADQTGRFCAAFVLAHQFRIIFVWPLNKQLLNHFKSKFTSCFWWSCWMVGFIIRIIFGGGSFAGIVNVDLTIWVDKHVLEAVHKWHIEVQMIKKTA